MFTTVSRRFGQHVNVLRAYQSTTQHRKSSTSYSESRGQQSKQWTWSERSHLSGKKLGKARLGQYFMSAWATWKKQHQTASWHRHFEQFRGQAGPGQRCLRDAVEQMKQRTARYVGTLRAGAPKKSPMQPIGRQLVAYLTPSDLRSTRPTQSLAFIELPSARTRGMLQVDICELVHAIVVQEVARLFKTSDILSRLSVLSRVTFSLLPLTLAFRFKAARIIRKRGEEALARTLYPTRGFVWTLFATPLVLVGVAYIASLERTPVTGRTRSLFVSEGEKSEIVKGFVGQRAEATADEWLRTLRCMLGDEAAGSPAHTLLGGTRIAAHDPRSLLVEQTLRELEAGIPMLGDTGPASTAGGLRVPQPSPPLANASPAPDYRVLLIDRPEANAFSCGFSPIGHGVGPGCIVVFSGCLDAISADAPTGVQREDLAVLLSHELAHLICSHTLEQHASDNQRPQLRKFFADGAWRLNTTSCTARLRTVARTVLWPVTFVFGPFVNEALSASLMTGFAHSQGFSSSCESRIHEAEADAVSLRILANAGFNPRISIRYWQQRIESPASGDNEAMHGVSSANAQWHSTRNRFLRSHPVDEERLNAIKADLAKWKRCAQ